MSKVLPSFDVITVTGMGWSGIKNGELLTRAAAEFDVFLTVDKNLIHQQSQRQLGKIAIVVIKAKANTFKNLMPLLSQIQTALANTETGQIAVVEHT